MKKISLILIGLLFFTTNAFGWGIDIFDADDQAKLDKITVTGGSTGDVMTVDGDGNIAPATPGAASVTNANVEDALSAGDEETTAPDTSFFPFIDAGDLNKISLTNLYLEIADGLASTFQAASAVLDNVVSYVTVTQAVNLDTMESDIATNNAKPTISSGAGAPSSTPSKVGDVYIDTTGDDAYTAVGTASSADWEKANDGNDGGGGSGDLKADGTVPLTADWDVGAYIITGLRFVSDVVTGTAPFTVSSTTVVTNLNADTVDGQHASAFEPAGITESDISDLNHPTQSSLAVDDLISLSGVTEGAQNLGSFTGSTIPDNQNNKQALQAIETAVEGLGGGHDAVSLAASATTGGMSLLTQEISFQPATTGQNGYLTSTDWNTFNNKVTFPGFTSLLADYSFTDNSTNWDAAYTHISNNGSDHSYIDQSVVSGASPTFTGTNFSGVPHTAITGESWIESTGVTYGNLNTNGGVGTGSSQVAAGDHTHNEMWQGDSALSTNLSYYGRLVSVTAGETVAFGDILYLKKADHEWYKAVETTTNVQIVEAYCLGASTDGSPVNVLLRGYVRDDSWNWTIDDSVTNLWKSTSAGVITETLPSTSNNWAQVIGTIQTADILFFNPQLLQIEIP